METITKIENGEYELVLPNTKDPDPGYLLTLSREGYRLVDEANDVEFEDEETGRIVLKDIYYFVNDKEKEQGEPKVDLVKECNGAECIVVIHFEKLSSGTREERVDLRRAIVKALLEVDEHPDFAGGDRVTVETDDPGKVHTILKQFGW